MSGQSGGWQMRLKGPLKTLRASQPFNSLATTLVRGALSWRAQPWEWAVRHLHRVGHVEARLPNGHALRLWSRGDDWVSNQVFWRGWAGYEPETARLFFRLAEGARITLDVGAFVGYYSLLAAHANPEGRVFAFEPLPGPRQRLLHHLALNRLTRVECVAAAAGADDGDAQLFHVPEELPTSSSLSREFMAGARELNHLRVPVRALDRFLAEAGLEGVDLVKIDTESTELDVLRGLVRTLEYERPFVLCEVLQGRSNPRGLSDLLRPHSYRYYLLTGQGPIPKAVIEGDPVWLNYLFVPPGRELPR